MGTEKCPFCGQEIDADATRCFFCGSELDRESVDKRLEQLQKQDSSRRKVHSPGALVAVVGIILIYAVLFRGTSGVKRPPAVESQSERSTVQLNAKVTLAGARLTISNNDPFDWDSVELEIVSETAGDHFSLMVPKISAGETHTASATEFSGKDGTSFNPYTMKLDRVWVRGETPSGIGSYLAGLE